jgi:DNA-binding CsgD family transcriptional regulator
LWPPPAGEGIPISDPAHSILAGIVDVVPTRTWAFARIEHNGDVRPAVGPTPGELTRASMADEFRRQRIVVPAGARIAATIHAFAGIASGITLIFADARADYGIMLLLRDEAFAPFSSIEISMLTFALDAGSDRLAALRLQPPLGGTGNGRETPPAAPAWEIGPAARHEEAFYVLDRDLEIVLAWSEERQRRIALTGTPAHAAERLPPVLEDSVRELTAAWETSAVKQPGMARPVAFLVVRTQPMSGPAGLFVGVRIDRFQPPNSLTGAATRFHISPREVQVLALLLDGDHLDQIAQRLHITSSTVQDHIKSMLDKTESRNRSELIARILGWESSPNPRALI